MNENKNPAEQRDARLYRLRETLYDNDLIRVKGVHIEVLKNIYLGFDINDDVVQVLLEQDLKYPYDLRDVIRFWNNYDMGKRKFDKNRVFSRILDRISDQQYSGINAVEQEIFRMKLRDRIREQFWLWKEDFRNAAGR